MKKFLNVLLSCLLILCVFSACTAKDNANVASNDKEKNIETNKSAGNEGTSAVKLEGKIEFFQQKREAVDTFNAIIKKFQEEYPGITVEQNTIPDAGQVLITRMASGDAPDVFTHWPTGADFKVQAREGYVMELTNEGFMNNIQSNILDIIRIDGKDYALPISLNTMGVFYNVKKFEELNLTIPKTYDEFVSILKKTKDAGEVPLMLPDKDSWTIGQSSNLIAGILDPDLKIFYEQLEKGQISAKDNPDFVKHAEILLELRNYGQEDSLGTGYDQAIGEFAAERAVMFIQGIWAIPSIKKANPNLEFAMFPFPGLKEEDTRTIVNVDCAVAAASEGENKDLAKVFIEFLSRKETGQMYADLDGSPSAIKGVKTTVKEYELLSQLMNEGKTFLFPTAYWRPGVMEETRKNVQNLIAEKDIDAYLEAEMEIFKAAAEAAMD